MTVREPRKPQPKSLTVPTPASALVTVSTTITATHLPMIVSKNNIQIGSRAVGIQKDPKLILVQ